MPVKTLDARAQAKRLIAAIVSEAGADGLQGKVRLHKAFYLAHLSYLERTGRYLTGWDLVHMPFGPGIPGGESLVSELVREGAILATAEHEGPYPTARYRIARGVRIDPPLDPAEREAVAGAVAYVRARTGSELSAETHVYSRSWIETANGEPLNLGLDLLGEEEIQGMDANIGEARNLIEGVYGDAG